MSEAVIEANEVVIDYLTTPRTLYALRGGRRAGKTYNTMIYLLSKMIADGATIIIASMTDDAATKGAYSDAKDIIDRWGIASLVDVLISPKQIRSRNGRGVMYFKSYADPETAKGGACDYVFINEANKFTYAQYLDLSANARQAVICDYNPNDHFWIEDEIKTRGIEELCVTWKDNVKHLTANQLQYFETLKRKAEQPNASAVDLYYYRVYYLGEYGEMSGEIFTSYNLQFVDVLPVGLYNYTIFCDPSALRGADSFACVLTARDSAGVVYVIDTFSINEGTREMIVRKLLTWCKNYDIENVYIETNGIIGIDFYEFAQNSELPVQAWYSRANKFDRIVANYQNLTTRLRILDTETNRDYMTQVYTFSKKCEHDDNIDALNTSYNIQAFTG